jgi:hypothetical protein
MIEIDLDRETLDCLGLRRADDEFADWLRSMRPSLPDVLGPAPRVTSTFKETDIKRVIQAAQAAGLEVLGVVVTKDAIEVRTAKEEKRDEFSNDEIIRRLRDGNRRQA